VPKCAHVRKANPQQGKKGINVQVIILYSVGEMKDTETDLDSGSLNADGISSTKYIWHLYAYKLMSAQFTLDEFEDASETLESVNDHEGGTCRN